MSIHHQLALIGILRPHLEIGIKNAIGSLDKVTDKEIIEIQNRLNERPRKMLGFKTPNEIYSEMALAA
jgi:IS30 family transposase